MNLEATLNQGPVCPYCGGQSFDVYLGANAYHDGGLSLRCLTKDCPLETNLTRDEMIQKALMFAYFKASTS